MISHMRTTTIGESIGVGLVLALLLAGCGRYEPTPDHTSAPTTTPIDRSETVIRCVDAPHVPEDNPHVEVRRTNTKVTIGWVARHGWPGFTVHLDDPTCKDRPDLRQWLRPVGPFPRFEDARIVVRPGVDCAYVGYTLFGGVEGLIANLGDITAVREDGRSIDWKHQTATGGPAQIGAFDGREIVTPDGAECGVAGGGDADYFDARDVQVGETVRVTFRFLAVSDIDNWDGESPLEAKKVVEAPFKVVSGP